MLGNFLFLHITIYLFVQILRNIVTKKTRLNMTRPDSTFAPECSISSCVCDLTQDLKPHDEEDHQPGMPTLGDFLYSA